MKKKILFIFTISLFIFSCSSFDDYNEDNIQSEEIIDKVKELAYDYGINITINEDAINAYPEGLDLDSVEKMFSGMRNLAGIYEIEVKENGNKFTGILQPIKKRKITRSYESHSFGITQLINGNHNYNCTCEATWEVKGDTILNPHVHGTVEKVFTSDSGSSASYINVTNKTPIIGRNFSFDGKVVYTYTGFNIGYIDVTFNVSGTCGNENKIIWTL